MFPWNLFPFNKDAKSKMNGMKPADIQNYVQEMMDKMMPDSLQKMNPQDMFKNITSANNSTPTNQATNKLFNYVVFETHHHCFVRIPIADEAWLKNIKIYYTSNQVIIQHIPTEPDKHIITLPSVVRKKGSTATFKDNILEIKIQKSNEMSYSEIDVTEIN
ncbi:Hsp20/alpha crystallin family protein [Niallia nealsonii]|uniref:Spore coat protein n=1 Tax=Niallia nealsonii TaxID=115979 RepID=A0A2N0Z1N2_9BACI|nr:Hsp20/alpha crystallin family protein [Niallia nealsonii]PKG23412.1 spore coat protein [Niallia nealsonii]